MSSGFPAALARGRISAIRIGDRNFRRLQLAAYFRIRIHFPTHVFLTEFFRVLVRFDMPVPQYSFPEVFFSRTYIPFSSSFSIDRIHFPNHIYRTEFSG